MSEKKTCFVIQPFDDTYNGRYTRIYEPAIEKAGFFSYRVDADKSASTLTEEIQRRISSAHICFADISEDNPNVWYETGFAVACGKQIVMVCNQYRRSKDGDLPFHIRVENVRFYGNDVDETDGKAAKDLIGVIQESLKAKADKSAPVYLRNEDASRSGEVSAKLPYQEIICLKVLLENDSCMRCHDFIDAATARLVGYSHSPRAEANLAINSLGAVRGFIEIHEGENTYSITDPGKRWCANNRSEIYL